MRDVGFAEYAKIHRLYCPPLKTPITARTGIVLRGDRFVVRSAAPRPSKQLAHRRGGGSQENTYTNHIFPGGQLEAYHRKPRKPSCRGGRRPGACGWSGGFIIICVSTGIPRDRYRYRYGLNKGPSTSAPDTAGRRDTGQPRGLQG